MSGFHIHSGNQLESLAEVMAGFLRAPRGSGILEPEVVVVPSRGLERWLKLFLARVNGVSANLEFPFPQAFLEKKVFSTLRRQLDGKFDVDLFAEDILVWKIFFALEKIGCGENSDRREPDAVANYLRQTGDELSRYRLALELGDLFDRYLLLRPELIRAWERGENPLSQIAASAWQMKLWRELGLGAPKTHFAALHDLVNQLLYPEMFPEAPQVSLTELKSELPSRLFLFGFAALPFNYLDLFKALSRLTEVHLFHINPCAEFWGDQFRVGVGKASARLEKEGHPLLASWGRLGRAFFDLCAGLESDSYREYFVSPESTSLLAALQRQILELMPPSRPLICAAADNSLKINICHGRQREIEILYDTILAALEQDDELKPDEIFVLAPDIAVYVPYIEAFFARRSLSPGAVVLEHTIVSCESALDLPEIKAFFALMRLFESRFLLREIFDFFSREVVRRRFLVSESGLALLSEWLGRAQVNWGLDGSFREDVTGVDFAANSLFWGLDRLLTGYGLSGSDLYAGNPAAGSVWSDGTGADFLPLAGIEGAEALVLGNFARFAVTLRKARERLSGSLPAACWRAELERLLDEFIQPQTEEKSGCRRLRQAFAQIDKHFKNAVDPAAAENSAASLNQAAANPVSCATILTALERELNAGSGARGFFRGGITFSSILPLRAVPARMICVLGLNDGDFPRNKRPSAYDLISARPQAGDRNVRDEDRYLFLETLLAARKRLVLSYLGRDPKDNHLRPPTALISELIDYIEEHFTMAPDSGFESMRDFLIYDHPPQPFSRRYFTVSDEKAAVPAKLFSYDRLQAEIATRINNGNRAAPAPGFLEKPLAEVDYEQIDFIELLNFFKNPAQYFLKKRLKVSARIRDIADFGDSEPFILDALAGYKFNDELVNYFLADERDSADFSKDIAELEKRYTASGMLPPLTPGRVVFADKVAGARALAAQLKPYCGERLPALVETVTLQAAGRKLRVTFKFDNLFKGRDGILRQILFRPTAKLKNKDLVRTAMLNLGLELMLPLIKDFPDRAAGFNPVETRFHTLSDKSLLIMLPVDAVRARSELETLLELYQTGLRRPLPFLPELSLLWYKTWKEESLKNGSEAAAAAARDKVRSAWSSDYNYAARDEAFHMVFGNNLATEDFWAEFTDLARQLGPILLPRQGC